MILGLDFDEFGYDIGGFGPGVFDDWLLWSVILHRVLMSLDWMSLNSDWIVVSLRCILMMLDWMMGVLDGMLARLG